MIDLWSGEPQKLKGLSEQQAQVLAVQSIDSMKPGAIVHDFQVLLDFIGAGDVVVAGKLNLLPINILHDLNARMHAPLAVRLQRPQLKSFPNLQQLYLLLRATGLGVVRGTGKNAKLHLDPALLSSWNGLNPTERYFNLLDTFIHRGNPEILGERVGGFFAYEPLQKWLLTWSALGTTRGSGGPKQAVDRDFVTYHADALALMSLFGFITIEKGPPDAKDGRWHPRRAWQTPFGEVMLKLLTNYRILRSAAEENLPLTADGFNDGQPFVINDESADDDDDAIEPIAIGPEPLGQMQPLFDQLFPEWKNNLTAPPVLFQEGQFILKVSLGKSVWRRLSIPARESFDHLASWILRAFNFGGDHLYEFLLKDVSGAPVTVNHPHFKDGILSTDLQIGAASLTAGDSFIFHYDFGDDWEFEVLVEQIDPAGKKRQRTAILEKHGEAPDQYPSDEFE